MTNQTSHSQNSRPWRNFSLTVFACLASSALLSVACSGTGADDMGSGGTGPDTGGAPAATGGSGPGSGGGTATGGAAGCDIPDLLNKKCGSSICHGTPGDLTTVPLGSVNLLAPGVEGRIYNVDATYANRRADDTSVCPSTPEKLLDPAGVATSLMYTKINGGHACGDPMPNVGTVTAEQIACFNDWLAEVLANPPQ